MLIIFHILAWLSISPSAIECTVSRSSVSRRPSLRLRAHCSELPSNPVIISSQPEQCIQYVTASLGSLVLYLYPDDTFGKALFNVAQPRIGTRNAGTLCSAKAKSGSQGDEWNRKCLAEVAKVPLLLNLSVAMWLSSSDVESWRHSQMVAAI